jgi:RNase P/RNase MRP subunit p29
MYAEQFELLQAGDVIKSKNNTLRIIVKTSESHITKDGRTYTIYLEKLRPSWTRGNLTAISIGDASRFRPVKVKNKKIYDWDRERVLSIRKKIKVDYLLKQQKELTKKLKKI